MSSIHILSKQCIKNANIIKAICPSHISTRWIYDYDIVKFIVDHRLKISQFANIPYGIDEMCADSWRFAQTRYLKNKGEQQ